MSVMAERGAAPRGKHVEIWASGLSASIDPWGAQLMSLTTARGDELLWQGDPAFWPDRAPILFPVIGPVAGGVIHHDGGDYPMPPHGFAKEREFTVKGYMRNRAVFDLSADDRTRKQYPFEFGLRVAYDLRPDSLTVTIAVTNEDTVSMPADVGFHPGFNCPLSAESANMVIEFDEREAAPVRRGVDDPIFLTEDEYPSPVEGRTLRLRDELFTDNAIVFDRVASRGLVYRSSDTSVRPQLRVEYPDSPYLAIWSRPGAPFVAIEPWQGLPSPVGYTGELGDKPGIATLAPGETRAWRLRVIIDPLKET
jgi:galactose mutarotase-like enzyme